jgi:hypothetical protein
MDSIDEIVKKAELFEKLAVYGDRKSFLQAIAQEDGSHISQQALAELDPTEAN